MRVETVLAKKEKYALVIGLGGIGQAVVRALINTGEFSKVFGVSRRNVSAVINEDKFSLIQVADYEASSISEACTYLPKNAMTCVVCCLGNLHDEKKGVFPEKKLEDIDAEQFAHYFHSNVTLPALWLKHLPALLPKVQPSKIAFLSARVGSITDNQLGGWYGYRSSKAALNMLIKTAQVELARRYKQCALMLYHPGTVDTRLSAPFQANVPQEKLFTPEFTATQLVSLLPRISVEGAPHYRDWKGEVIPW